MDIHIKGAIISALIIALILTAAAQAFTGLPMDVVSHPFTLGNPIAVVYGCALVGVIAGAWAALIAVATRE